MNWTRIQKAVEEIEQEKRDRDVSNQVYDIFKELKVPYCKEVKE